MSEPATASVDYADIQGNILRAYGKSYDRTSYLLVGIARAEGGRSWLGSLLADVTTAEEWPGPKPPTTLNVALTFTGLRALGVSESLLGTFSEEFREGMAARAQILGDGGVSAPAGWEPPFGTGDAHVLITINARTTELLEARLAGFRAAAAAAGGVRILNEEHAQLLPKAREHFGYEDGFAQPAIAGVTDHRTLGGGVPEAGDRWRGLALGEFILGYPDEDSRAAGEPLLPPAPAAPLGRSGTYMVLRKLSQDVALFRETLRRAAARYDGDEEKLAAKIVGRWRNGTPLVSSPDAADPAFRPEVLSGNAFRYLDDDENGFRCPLGAHIRRTNPRDALGWKGLSDSGLLGYRHRIIRRGMPYGPPLPADATGTGPGAGSATPGAGERGLMHTGHDAATADPGGGPVDRGLMFVCFNASISRQFEGIQTQWVNDGNALGLGHDRDYLLGDSSTTDKMTIQGSPPFFLAPQPSFVTTRGGEYLFVPGIAALHALAAGTV